MPDDDLSGRATKRPPNRLAAERSLYLRQHARNPVDWYPWSDEAFAEAARLDRPVFLSIGYSSCHWCHVMERESFEDEKVASLLNSGFVAIKVDREERPDLDHYYMSVCQALTGSGGWPLTVFLTPDRHPFFAGTYFPKAGRYGRTGLLELLPRLSEIWKTRRDDVLASAAEIARAPARLQPERGGAALDRGLLDEAFRSLRREFDTKHGGFGTAPKFPIPHNLLFLLRYWRRTEEGAALAMVEKTLTAMRRGGIFDQVGLGFHRYSTDERWLVPHFEKMLYDQALLAMAYTEASQAAAESFYRKTAEEILAYVARDLATEDGLFASSVDADAAGGEGSFYLWTEGEIREALPPEDGELAVRVFGVSGEGNLLEEEPTGPGRNVLTLAETPAETASGTGLSEPEAEAKISAIRERLRKARDRRPKPARDAKVLADWNGLIIAAFAKAACAFGRRDDLDAATRAADRLLTVLVRADGTFLRSRDGDEARIPAFLDDHAFAAWGLIELYEAGFELRHLEAALALARRAIDRFWDEAAGGFFFAPDDMPPEIPLRKKESYDGAVPSGNAAMMLVLLRLARMTGDPAFEERAARTGAAFAGAIARSPAAHTLWMTALELAAGPSIEIVVVGRRGAADTQALLGVIRSSYLPNAVILLKPADDPRDAEKLAGIAPFVSEMTPVNGAAAAYFCSGFVCGPPETDPEELRRLLVTRRRTN